MLRNKNIALQDGGIADEFLSDFEELLPDGYASLADPEVLTERISDGGIFSELGEAISSGLSGSLGFFSLLLGAAVLIALAGLAEGRLRSPVRLSVSVAAVLLVWGELADTAKAITAALGELSELFFGIGTLVSALSAAGGAAASAGVQTAGLSLTLTVFGNGTAALLTTLVRAVLASSLVGAALGGAAEGVARGVRSFFTFGLGIMTAGVLGILSLQTLVASAADSAALRAAKYAASGMIPVVGGAVSGALGALSSGLSYVGDIIGAGGVLVIISLSLGTGVRLLLMRLSLSLSLIFLELAGSREGVRSFSAIRGAIDALISVYFLSCIVYIFEIVLFVKSGVGLV